MTAFIWATRPTSLPPAKPTWPLYVLWWVAGDRVPEWCEAVERLEHLHDHGTTAEAFDWEMPFDAAGQACRLDRGRIKCLPSRTEGPTTDPDSLHVIPHERRIPLSTELC